LSDNVTSEEEIKHQTNRCYHRFSCFIRIP